MEPKKGEKIKSLVDGICKRKLYLKAFGSAY